MMAGLRTWILLLLCQFTLWAASQNGPIKYEIPEELPPNTLIGNIALDASMGSKYNMSILGSLRFSFLTTPQDLDESLFAIEERSGILQTTSRVDRDTICPGIEVCALMFDVAIRPAKYFQIIKVRIEIADINDNDPYFPQDRIDYEISESTLPGKSFSIPAALDPDSAYYSVQDYELVSNSQTSDKFELKVRETADGAIDLRLVLMEELDREELSKYQVKIVAHDGGRPAKSGSVLIDINVLDANDNDPKFENASYEVYVLENIPIGTTVIRVRARDPDQGLNGKVEYSFSRHTEQNYGDIFGIDSETGEIFVKGELNYEIAYIYLLSVTAQDKGPDSLPAHANVVVRVQDVNDNAPQITVNTLTTTGDAHVTENTPPGTFVAHISVLDEDSGENGKVACTLDNDNFLLQKLYMTEYKIVTATTFDRERQPYFDLRLQCFDRGSHPLSSFAHIRVTVMDENDHSPEFTQQFYTATLTENNYMDDFLVAVTATDRDEGKNGWVRYELHEDSQSLVAIDKDTGWITANVIFDHEELQELRFHVIATDKGSESKSTTATVLITVLDVDDEKPEFIQERYPFGTFENQPAGTEVGQVVAKDRDSDPYNYFTYMLDPERSDLDTFEIDPYDGKIRTKRILDREEQSVYFMVAVAHGEGQSKSSSASVSVYVADKNDNDPVFDFPTELNHTIHVSNQVPTGHVITRLKAHDRDTGKNAKLVYKVHDGNDDQYFTLDSGTGAITINRDLTHLKKKRFMMHIRVEDQGEPQLAALSELTIVVNNALGYQRSSSGLSISRDNLIILIVFASATFIISSIIIATIIIIRRKDRQRETENSKKEMEKMLPPPPPPVPTETPSGATHKYTPEGQRYISAQDLNKIKQNTIGRRNENSSRTDMTFRQNDLGNKPVHKAPPGGGSHHPLKEECNPEDLPPPPESWVTGGATTQNHTGATLPPSQSFHEPYRSPLLPRSSPQPQYSATLDPRPHLRAPRTTGALARQSWTSLDGRLEEMVLLRLQALLNPTQAEDSDSGSSGLSNSDSGRGPSSEDDDLNHKLSLEALPRTERTDGDKKKPDADGQGKPLQRSQLSEMSGNAVVSQRPPPDVVTKPSNQVTVPIRPPRGSHGNTGISQSPSTISLGSQSTLPSRADGPTPPKMVTFGQLHPHNLTRDSPDGVPSQRRSPLPERSTHTLPLTGRTTPTQKVPIRIHRQYIPPSPQERDDYISYTIYSSPKDGQSQQKIGGIKPPDADQEFVVLNCDSVKQKKESKDRTTDV